VRSLGASVALAVLVAIRAHAAISGVVHADEEPSRGRTITGKVVDASGHAVAKVSISAWSGAFGAMEQTVESDPDGNFSIDGLSSARYDFKVLSDELAGEVRDVDVARVSSIVITVKPRAAASIYGTVRGIPEGMMVRNVLIVARDISTSADIDRDGNYRADNAPVGIVEVYALAMTEDFQRHVSRTVTIDVAPRSENRIDLVIDEGVTIRGRVMRGGEPAAGASVQFGDAVVIANNEGKYEIQVLPGAYDVNVWAHPPLRPFTFTTRYEVKADATFDIEVANERLAVHVFDAVTSLPVEGASVSAAGDEKHIPEQGVTDRDGMWRREIPGGTAKRIVVVKDGYATAIAPLSKDNTHPIEVALARSADVVIRIVDARDGTLIEGNAVTRDLAGNAVGAGTYTANDDGTVSVRVAPGTYRISAAAPGYGTETVTVTAPVGEVRIALPRSGTLRIHARSDARGKARLFRPDGEEYWICWCYGFNALRISGEWSTAEKVSPGPYILEVTLDGAKPQRFPVSVAERETTTVELP
jgi:hypothetical protein